MVLALAHFELAVSDLPESNFDGEHLLRAAKSKAFHLKLRFQRKYSLREIKLSTKPTNNHSILN